MVELQRCGAEAGSVMRPSETKILSEGKEKIECVSEIIYLGQLIFLNWVPSKEIQKRVTLDSKQDIFEGKF